MELSWSKDIRGKMKAQLEEDGTCRTSWQGEGEIEEPVVLDGQLSPRIKEVSAGGSLMPGESSQHSRAFCKSWSWTDSRREGCSLAAELLPRTPSESLTLLSLSEKLAEF